MFWTFVIFAVMGFLMFKLGVLSAIVAILAPGFKAALIVFAALAILFSRRWYKTEGGSNEST